MFFSSVFYFVVSAALLLYVSGEGDRRKKNRRYGRLELLGLEDSKKVPGDWNPLRMVRSSFGGGQVRVQAGSQKFKGIGTGTRTRKTSDYNKENNHQAKVTLSSFILKELENSVQELTQKLPDHLNPQANEFLSLAPHSKNS